MRRLTPFLITLLVLNACTSVPYDADAATHPYPFELGTGELIDVQVFRDGDTLTLVNATAVTYRDVDVWINQRYLCHLGELKAGGRARMPISRFWDEWGGAPNPGGILRRYDPTPVRVVEFQLDDHSPLLGTITIRAEDPEK